MRDQLSHLAAVAGRCRISPSHAVVHCRRVPHWRRQRIHRLAVGAPALALVHVDGWSAALAHGTSRSPIMLERSSSSRILTQRHSRPNAALAEHHT
jgi:hypothetical protein